MKNSAFAPMPKQRAITPEGYPFIVLGVVITILAVLTGSVLIAALFALLTLFACFFFRNPTREVSSEPGTITAPADGKIVSIEDAEDETKVSIFMSVFNCHVNRVPVNGVVEGVTYRPGRFFVAVKDKASEQNEQNTILMRDESGRELRIVQIAGLIARRIVCYLKEGLKVEKGSRLGLIRFGSRVDLFVPKGAARLEVKEGDRVRAGESVIARWL